MNFLLKRPPSQVPPPPSSGKDAEDKTLIAILALLAVLVSLGLLFINSRGLLVRCFLYKFTSASQPNAAEDCNFTSSASPDKIEGF